MKYLYIPTTTLNFNNILSTGSISPAAVYLARRFGYNRFELVPPNPFQNLLLLYDRYPVYTIGDADRDNHPLIIRIRADRVSNGLQAARDILICDKTIYLDPASTEFIFANQEAMKVSLIKAEPSLTTKLISLYQSHMLVYDPALHDSFKWLKVMLDSLDGRNDDARDTVLKSCESDERINRLKGFICGYICGAYKSISNKEAKSRSELKERINKISARLNDPTVSNHALLRIDLESCSKQYQLLIKKVGDLRFDPDHGDKIDINNLAVLALNDRHEADRKSTDSLIKLFNDFCISSNFYGQFDEVRLNIALDGAKVIKDILGNKWEKSEYQTYINALLNNIKSGSPFEFNSSKSLTLKSFAAFVQKGDDLDKLETFLVDQGIGDFRIAFALWGAMFGFSKIPKTVYNLPDLRGETSYTKKMHNYVHSVVHAIPLQELEVSERPPKSTVPTGTPTPDLPPEIIEAIQPNEQWLSEVVSIWHKCGGVLESFMKCIKNTTSTDLGGRARKGTSKESFLRSITDYFLRPSFALDTQKPLKFWDDPLAWEAICNAVPSKYHAEIKMDSLEWFQTDWQAANSKYYGWENKDAYCPIKDTSLEHRTNADAISYFISHLKNKRTKKIKEGREFLEEAAIEKIRILLTDKYS